MNAKNFEDLTNKLDTIKDAVCSKSFFFFFFHLPEPTFHLPEVIN